MEYLEKQLGLAVHSTSWDGAHRLPYMYDDLYEFRKVIIGEVESLFLRPKEDLASLPTLKKHIAKIQQIESVPVVFELQNLSWHRQQAMRQENIPYILQERQIYLPFLGVILYKTRKRNEILEKSKEKFTPATQLLFLKYIYYLLGYKNDLTKSFYPGDYAKELEISNMTVTRAVEQIKQLEVVHTEKHGTKVCLQTSLTGKELFQRAKWYLDSPVLKVVYMRKEDIISNSGCFFKAGESALAMLTLLNEPKKESYALEKKIIKQFQVQKEFIDESKQVEIEIWKYNPGLLSCGKCVDALSLILSLEISDERIEQMIEELIDSL